MNKSSRNGLRSGAAYGGEPQNVSNCWLEPLINCVLNPKSANLTLYSVTSNTFSALISR